VVLRGPQTAITVYASQCPKYACVLHSAKHPTLQESKSVLLRKFVTRTDLLCPAVGGRYPLYDVRLIHTICLQLTLHSIPVYYRSRNYLQITENINFANEMIT
jgi:hypothetical protein